jgi:hypothetical protein
MRAEAQLRRAPPRLRPAAAKGGVLLVVIPARDEEPRIADVIRRVRESVPDAEILVVEDGSVDRTVERAREAGARVASLPVPLGYGGALQTGFRYAAAHGFETVVTLDADGQHPPEAIPLLLRRLAQTDADLVLASRFVTDTGYRAGALRRLTMRCFSLVASALAGQPIRDTTSGFQALPRRAFERFALAYPPDYPNAEVLVELARRGGRIVEVSVAMTARSGGRAMFGLSTSLYYVLKMSLSLLMLLLRPRRLRP